MQCTVTAEVSERVSREKDRLPRAIQTRIQPGTILASRVSEEIVHPRSRQMLQRSCEILNLDVHLSISSFLSQEEEGQTIIAKPSKSPLETISTGREGMRVLLFVFYPPPPTYMRVINV